MRSGKFGPTPAEDGRSAFPTAYFQGSWGAPGPRRCAPCAEERALGFPASGATFRLPRVVPNGPEGMLPQTCRATECAQTRGGARPWIFGLELDSSISTLHFSDSAERRGRGSPRAYSFCSPLEWYVRAPRSLHLRSVASRPPTTNLRCKRAGRPRGHRCCPHARMSSHAKNQPRSFFDLYSSIFRSP